MVVNVDTSVYDCIVSLFLEDVGPFLYSRGYLAGASGKDLKHAAENRLDRYPSAWS